MVLTKNREVINKRKEYFKELLNKGFPREAVDQVEWNLGMVD